MGIDHRPCAHGARFFGDKYFHFVPYGVDPETGVIDYDKMEQMGILSPVVSVGCEYKTMAKFGETVIIEAKIKEYNGVSLVLDYVVCPYNLQNMVE